ncbi:nuclear receptor subfamily 1 group I member 2-like isoform X6 [Poecile atricapillus]|uniref:nuclear receptor subfamily 1 group I member 2-like isoform X6 n=1 Tax=Poecile atricapillus TaxID=48891 RepID=UPI00273A18E8|nr:nuclear receptor subfamily 1 group I member 2-like isoform X6 [Poecile atricapillus]
MDATHGGGHEGTLGDRQGHSGTLGDRHGHSGTHGDRQGHSGTLGDRQGHSGTLGDRQGHSGTHGDRQGHSGTLGDRHGHSGTLGDRQGHSGTHGDRQGHEGTLGDRQGHSGTLGDSRGPGVPSACGDNPPSPTAPGDTGSGVSLESPPGTERGPRDPPGDTEPDGDKVCAVCGDKASGYHFHVMSCEGCKGFFRRSVIKGVTFTCPLSRRCPVTKAKRRQCQACRMQKCLAVGMRRDMIMSEEALRRRRELRGQRGQPGGQSGGQPGGQSGGQSGGQPGGQPGGQQGLTAEQQELIALLIAAHQRTFDSSFSQFVHCWQVIKFAKEIPVFRSLSLDTQISLLKGATLGICQIRFNTVFNTDTKAWECGQRCYTIRDGAMDHGVAQREVIDAFQEQLALTLQSYIEHQHPPEEGRLLYAKLLLLLTELQTLMVENTRQILHIQELSAMTPLLSEIIS